MDSTIAGRLALSGVVLAMDGETLRATPSSAVTAALRDFIAAHRQQIVDSLQPSPWGQKERRRRVLAKLEAEPERRVVAIIDDASSLKDIVVTVAVRNVGTWEMRLPKENFDPFAYLEALGHASKSPAESSTCLVTMPYQ